MLRAFRKQSTVKLRQVQVTSQRARRWHVGKFIKSGSNVPNLMMITTPTILIVNYSDKHELHQFFLGVIFTQAYNRLQNSWPIRVTTLSWRHSGGRTEHFCNSLYANFPTLRISDVFFRQCHRLNVSNAWHVVLHNCLICCLSWVVFLISVCF